MLRLKDATVDRVNGAFVMVLQGEGYEPLVQGLATPAGLTWLGGRSVAKRVQLWSALKSLAHGLALLHRQQVLHPRSPRRASSLILRGGPRPFASVDSSGASVSVRLADARPRFPPGQLLRSLVPTRSRTFLTQTGSRFGMLAARLVSNLEHLSASAAPSLHSSVVQHLAAISAKDLARARVDLLLRLIATDPLARLRHFDEIVREIEEIERLLSGHADGRSASLVMVVDPKSQPLVEAMTAVGLVFDEDEFAPFNPLDQRHTAALSAFVRQGCRTRFCCRPRTPRPS